MGDLAPLPFQFLGSFIPKYVLACRSASFCVSPRDAVPFRLPGSGGSTPSGKGTSPISWEGTLLDKWNFPARKYLRLLHQTLTALGTVASILWSDQLSDRSSTHTLVCPFCGRVPALAELHGAGPHSPP